MVNEQTMRADAAMRSTTRSFAAVALKGKGEPVAALASALGDGAASASTRTRSPRRRSSAGTASSSLLEDTFERMLAESEIQLVTITGEPGVGKTRLLAEFRTWVDDRPELVSWRQGRCLPYGDGITFWALGEIVKAHAGILESDGPAEAAAKLETTVAEMTDGRWLHARLGPLVGVAGGEVVEREESYAAWQRFLEEIAATGPLVLLFEDLHWADPALLTFVERLVDWSRGLPILVLCTGRPELFERHPTWGGGTRNATTVSLSPLSLGRDGAASVQPARDGRAPCGDERRAPRAGGRQPAVHRGVRAALPGARVRRICPCPTRCTGS